MSDVFISYSRDDLEKVSQIAAAVAEQGYDLWWDKDLPPHLSYTEVIQEKIGGAKAVIVVWSETASKSEWVRAEADMARNQNKLVQTSIDDGMPPLPFNQIQFASLSDWSGESDHRDWSKVLQSLSDLVGRKATPPPKPKPKAEPVAVTPPPAPSPAPAPVSSGSSNLPLVISLLALALVVGAVAWLVLGRDAAAPAAEEPQAEEIAANEEEPATDAGDASAASLMPAKSEPAIPAPQPAKSGEFNESAVIEDADGWTNFRAGPTRSATILGRIESGEIFYTHRQSGNWWKIRTEDGEIGYMHYSRIALTTTIANQPKLYFPDSASRVITAAEISQLSKSELRLARNEIFARRGRIFDSADLREHFSRFDWYEPVRTEVEINDIERANVQALQAAERQR